MINSPIDFNAAIDFSKKAFAPAARFNELAAQQFERIARQQYAFAGELLELSLKQLSLASQSKDVNELASKQVELTTQFIEKTTARSQDIVRFATEAQAQVTKWFDDTTAEYTAQARKVEVPTMAKKAA